MATAHEKIRSVNSTDHDLVKETLSQFFVKLARSHGTDQKLWLESIEFVLIRYPKYCLSHRTAIELYLIPFLDSNSPHLTIATAKCAHLLQQVRPSNEKTANAKSSWRTQMSILCSAAHSVMNDAFAHSVDIYKASGYFQKNSAVEKPESTPLSDALTKLQSTDIVIGKSGGDPITLNYVQKNTVLCKRLKNVFTFVQAMLVEVYPVAKPVRPQVILDMLVRALSITSGKNRSSMNEDDVRVLDDNIAQVKIQALRTLDAMIVCLGSNLVPYSPLVFRLATQTLRWTSDSGSTASTGVRRACYSTLVRWLRSLACHKPEAGRGGALSELLVAAILDDITPHVNTVQLTMSNQSMKNLSKKAKRKMANTILNQSAIASHIPGEKNKAHILEDDPALIVSALECLEVFLITCGMFINATVHKNIQDVLVDCCYRLDDACAVPHGLALCRALEASRLGVASTVAPPTQHCLQVYGRLAASRHVEIAQFCYNCLLSIRAMLHAAPPTLTFAPPPLVEERKEKETAVVSERNRAALASLLGEDRIPPPTIQGTVINIHDSPLKIRLDDDRISVSSHSSTEVQIDESNGVDLDSPTSELGEVERLSPEPSNGKRALINPGNKRDIYEMQTQLPDVSTIIIDNDSCQSIEIAYDHTGDKTEEVTFLEKIDADNLPSTGETDEMLNCGQTVMNSQDLSAENRIKDVQSSEIGNEPMVIDADQVTPVEREVVNEKDIVNVDGGDNLNVEDMLADFVDEKA